MFLQLCIIFESLFSSFCEKRQKSCSKKPILLFKRNQILPLFNITVMKQWLFLRSVLIRPAVTYRYDASINDASWNFTRRQIVSSHKNMLRFGSVFLFHCIVLKVIVRTNYFYKIEHSRSKCFI